MSEYELGQILKKMYDEAPKGERALNVHLFGIKYADILCSPDISIKEVVKNSGLQITYATEVTKGVKLANYVEVK